MLRDRDCIGTGSRVLFLPLPFHPDCEIGGAMISEMLAFFLICHESKDQATGVGEFLSTSSSPPRLGCKERPRGGGTFLVSVSIQHGWK